MPSCPKISSTIVILTLAFCPRAAQADIIYELEPYLAFNDFNWGLTGGRMTTDGTLGEITPANIIDWSINYFSNERTFTLTPSNSVRFFFNDAAGGLTATATQLLMVGTADAGGPNEQMLFLEPTPSFQYGVGYFASEPTDVGGISLYDSGTNPQSSSMLVTNAATFLIGTAIPEPGTRLLLLFTLAVAIVFRRCPSNRVEMPPALSGTS